MEHLCQGRRGLDQFEWPLHSQDQTRSVWRESDANLRLRTGTRSCGMALSHCTRIEAPHVRVNYGMLWVLQFFRLQRFRAAVFFSAPATLLAVRCQHLRVRISSATVVVACACVIDDTNTALTVPQPFYGSGSDRRKRAITF